MEINIQEILIKHQKIVAQKHNLGNSLVTGHKKGYFDESFNSAIKDIIIAVLQEAADSAITNDDIDGDSGEGSFWVDKESITSTINKVKF
jgi:hypothetical protein